MNLEVFGFFYFSKKANFLPQKLLFLVMGYLKKINTAFDHCKPHNEVKPPKIIQ